MRKKRSIFLAPLFLIGACSMLRKEPIIDNFPQQKFTLEGLCDTEIEQRCLDFHVYLSPFQPDAQRIYEDRIFPLVGEFFSQQLINCKFVFESEPLMPDMRPDKIGVEVYFNQEDYVNRYRFLNKIDKSEVNPDAIRDSKGMAVLKSNIALFDGGWRTFYVMGFPRTTFPWSYSSVEHEELLEYMVQEDANVISHETGHLLGLPHPFQCSEIFQTPEEEVNIMSYKTPDFELYPLIGGVFTNEQLQFIHSRIAGRGVYSSIQECNSFSTYLENLNNINNSNN